MTASPLRICFVASEILGAHKNGGIGTATTHLALFLARSGHEVTIVYTSAPWIDYLHPWIRRCEDAGIALVHLDARYGALFPTWLRETSVICDYLCGTDYDVILFQDWDGLAFASIEAKRGGLAFDRTTLAVIAHGPTAWLLGANRALAADHRTLALLHMEGSAFEHADAIICPSRHMLDWLRGSGMPLAKRIEALPLYLWSDPDDARADRRGTGLDSVDRVAFFGRLETRKGVDLFIDAVVSDELAGRCFEVAFIGKPASRTLQDIRDAIALRCPSLVDRLTFEPDLDTDAAQAFLRDGGWLAVIPSLVDNAPCVISECLRRGIPFLSTATGGIPELIAAEDVSRVLVEPRASALAARIGDLLGRGFTPARPAYTEASVGARWLHWFAETASGRPVAPARVDSSERVAVIVTHFERPGLVAQALESLAAQTRTDFDVLLVDDGSRSAAAISGLAELECRSWPFRFSILRQPNGYLGAARNAGVRAVSAERVIFLDDDNLAFPDLVQRLDEAMSRTGADIVTCQMSIFHDASGEPDPFRVGDAERWGFLGGPTELGLSVNCYGDATGIYRRSVFDRIGFFHERRGIGYEDWELHARASLAGLSIMSLPRSLYWYRRVSTGMLLSTDSYDNHRVVRETYARALPPRLQRLVDLSIITPPS